MAIEYVVAKNPAGVAILIIVLLVFLITKFTAFLVNGFLCYAILWVVPVFCFLAWFGAVLEQPDGAFGILVFGTIWLYFFLLIFWLIGSWLGEIWINGAPAYDQQSNTLLGVVRNSGNVLPEIGKVSLALLVAWFVGAVIGNQKSN